MQNTANEAKYAMNEIVDRGISVLRVQGDLDIDSRQGFKAAITKLMETSQMKLVLDLTQTTKLFSVFIGTIVDLNSRIEASGRTLSILCSPHLNSIFKATNLDEVLNLIEVK